MHNLFFQPQFTIWFGLAGRYLGYLFYLLTVLLYWSPVSLLYILAQFMRPFGSIRRTTVHPCEIDVVFVN